MKNINLNKYLNKIASQRSKNRGSWEPPHHFGEEMLAICKCCIQLSNTGRWPPPAPDDYGDGEVDYCNPGPNIDVDRQCTRYIGGGTGLGTFDYTQSGRDVAANLLYIIEHWGERFYPASCLTDLNCDWWPFYYDEHVTCCVEEGPMGGNCENNTPIVVCDLHDGKEVANCDDCVNDPLQPNKPLRNKK